MTAHPNHQAGWTTYDPFTGPTLDPNRWEALDFGAGPRLEPGARTTVGDGVVSVEIAEFTNRDATNQGLDNTKHLLTSTQGFRLPADGAARFAVDLRADVGDGSGDYRQGIASFVLVDTTGGTHTVLAIVTNGERFFAEQEILEVPGHEGAYTRIIEDPFHFVRSGDRPDPEFRHCEIEIDRSQGRVVWSIDGQVLHESGGLEGLPEEVHLGFGMFTLLPIAEGRSSNHGQGGRATWRNFSYRLPGPDSR